MHIVRTDIVGNPNIGLFGYATDKHVLLGEHLQEKTEREIAQAMKADVHHGRIAGTNLPGLFLVGNSKVTLVPSIAFPQELAALDRIGIPYKVLHALTTCLGNAIACNDHGAIVSSEFLPSEVEEIERLLKVPVVQMDIAGLTTPGAVILTRGDKGVIHRDASEEQVAIVERTLKVTLELATVGLGTPYLKAAIMLNRHGFVVGTASGGPEIVRIDEALGYLEE